MSEHAKVCHWWNLHDWTKWEDCTIPWIWWTQPPIKSRIPAQRRYCTRCNKSQTRKVNVAAT